MQSTDDPMVMGPSRGLIALGAALGLLLAACSGATPAPGGGTPMAPGGTAAPGETTTAGESATPATSTPLPTAEAAAVATALKATEAAAVLPSYVATFGAAGTGPGQIMLPFDVALAPDGSMYISDSTGVQKFDPDGGFVRRIDEGKLPLAEGIAVGPDGRLFVTGYGAQVLVYDAEGNPAGTVGTVGEAPGQLMKPTDVAIDGAGNLYVADSGNARIEKFSPSGAHLQTIGERGSESGQFTAPRSVALDAEGRIYVGMGDDFLVQRFNPDGTYLDTFGQGALNETISRTGGVAVGPDGRAYVSQAMAHSLQVFDLAGQPAFLAQMGGQSGITNEQFNSPTGVTINGNRVYVADTRNNRILVFEIR